MTSIHTNTGAKSALQIMRSINSRMSEAQSEISSGLRVKVAADNAAYWSIATTMRSDNKAISAIRDSIGLSQALVDTHVASLNSVVDLLAEFKSKLVLASEPGTDRAKVQKELEALKAGLRDIAGSSSFSGENWLSTNIANLPYLSEVIKSVPSYLSRGDYGITVGMTDIDVSGLSLFNVDGGGALQTDIRSLGQIGGLRDANFNSVASPGYIQFNNKLPVTFGSGDVVSFDITLDASAYSAGTTFTVTIDKNLIDTVLGTTDGKVSTHMELSDVVTKATWDAAMSRRIGMIFDWTTISWYTGDFNGHLGSSVNISNLSYPPLVGAFGLEDGPTTVYAGGYASHSFAFAGPFRVFRDVEFTFDILLNDEIDPREITVTRDIVDTVLGTTDGLITSADDMAQVLNHVLTGEGLTASASGGNVVLQIDPALYPAMGTQSIIRLNNVASNIGDVPDFNILDVDITEPTSDLAHYLRGLDMMEKKVINGAASLGSVKAGLDRQDDFIFSIQQAIDEGIGRLVDADMDEASARMKALQAQEQMSIQALNIANAEAQNILSLFR